MDIPPEYVHAAHHLFADAAQHIHAFYIKQSFPFNEALCPKPSKLSWWHFIGKSNKVPDHSPFPFIPSATTHPLLVVAVFDTQLYKNPSIIKKLLFGTKITRNSNHDYDHVFYRPLPTPPNQMNDKPHTHRHLLMTKTEQKQTCKKVLATTTSNFSYQEQKQSATDRSSYAMSDTQTASTLLSHLRLVMITNYIEIKKKKKVEKNITCTVRARPL